MYFTSWRIKRFTGESVSCQRIEDRFYNPVKEPQQLLQQGSRNIWCLGNPFALLLYSLSSSVTIMLPLKEMATFMNLIFALLLSCATYKALYFSLPFCQVLSHVFWCSVVRRIHVKDCKGELTLIIR